MYLMTKKKIFWRNYSQWTPRNNLPHLRYWRLWRSGIMVQKKGNETHVRYFKKYPASDNSVFLSLSKICLGILMVFIFYFHFFSLIFFFCHIWRKIYIFSYFRNILTFDFTVDHLLIVKIPKEPLKFSF